MKKLTSIIIMLLMTTSLIFAYDLEYHDFKYNKNQSFEDALEVVINSDDELEIVYESVYQSVYQHVYDNYNTSDFEIILTSAQLHAWQDEEIDEITFDEFISQKIHDNGNKHGILKRNNETNYNKNANKEKKVNIKSNGKGNAYGQNIEGTAKGFRAFYDNINWSEGFKENLDIITKTGNPKPGKFYYHYENIDVDRNNIMLEGFKLTTDSDKTFIEFLNTPEVDESIKIAIHLEFEIKIHSPEELNIKFAGWGGENQFEGSNWAVYMIYND